MSGEALRCKKRMAKRLTSDAVCVLQFVDRMEFGDLDVERTATCVAPLKYNPAMPFKLVEKQVVYTGKKLRLEIHHLEDEEHEGRRTQREVCVHNGSVAILPFLDERTILLIRNRRYAISQLLLELPAGTMEKGEAP